MLFTDALLKRFLLANINSLWDLLMDLPTLIQKCIDMLSYMLFSSGSDSMDKPLGNSITGNFEGYSFSSQFMNYQIFDD